MSSNSYNYLKLDIFLLIAPICSGHRHKRLELKIVRGIIETDLDVDRAAGMRCLICSLYKLYADSISMKGLIVCIFFTPPDNRAVSLGCGSERLGIKFDIYFRSPFEGNF